MAARDPNTGLLRRRSTLGVNEDEAIIYDPFSHDLRKAKVQQIDTNKNYRRVQIPKFKQKVDVYLDIKPAGDGASGEDSRFLATVNLNSLGFTMTIKRHLGMLEYIYILDKAPSKSKLRGPEDICCE